MPLNTEFSQEQIQTLDMLYRQACERIAFLEKKLPVLEIGDTVWCIINISTMVTGKPEDFYASKPLKREVKSIHKYKDYIEYQLEDRVITELSLGCTSFRYEKEAENKIKQYKKEIKNG